MATQFNQIPDYSNPLMDRGFIAKAWYLYWSNSFQGLPPGNVVPVVLGASPYVYNAPVKGFVIVSGGTVSAVAFSRDGVTYYATGQTTGQFTLSAQDFLRITYTVAPTTTFVPT